MSYSAISDNLFDTYDADLEQSFKSVQDKLTGEIATTSGGQSTVILVVLSSVDGFNKRRERHR